MTFLINSEFSLQDIHVYLVSIFLTIDYAPNLCLNLKNLSFSLILYYLNKNVFVMQAVATTSSVYHVLQLEKSVFWLVFSLDCKCLKCESSNKINTMINLLYKNHFVDFYS